MNKLISTFGLLILLGCESQNKTINNLISRESDNLNHCYIRCIKYAQSYAGYQTFMREAESCIKIYCKKDKCK